MPVTVKKATVDSEFIDFRDLPTKEQQIKSYPERKRVASVAAGDLHGNVFKLLQLLICCGYCFCDLPAQSKIYTAYKGRDYRTFKDELDRIEFDKFVCRHKKLILLGIPFVIVAGLII